MLAIDSLSNMMSKDAVTKDPTKAIATIYWENFYPLYMMHALFWGSSLTTSISLRATITPLFAVFYKRVEL